MLETSKTFVNTWECDENNHLNVQFYFDRFEDADSHFRLLTGLDADRLGPRRTRHVRYHRESHVGDLQTVTSGVADASADTVSLVHVLTDEASGEISATALDVYDPPSPLANALTADLPRLPDDLRATVMPRSFVDPAPACTATPEDILEAGGFTTARGRVLPAQCTAEGRMDDRFVIATLSNAASHVWEASPLTKDWLDANSYGRVAMEMRVVYGGAIPAGTLTHVVSKWMQAGRTVFSFRHHIFDARSGACRVIVDSAGLVMDLNKRKSVPLSEDFRATLNSLAGCAAE
ncbi:MAG: thioesterase family protein [Pseudomonadota bacterium]